VETEAVGYLRTSLKYLEYKDIPAYKEGDDQLKA